nr:MAG TPA: hypothetical protein [Caudoviricetes sp.]
MRKQQKKVSSKKYSKIKDCLMYKSSGIYVNLAT